MDGPGFDDHFQRLIYEQAHAAQAAAGQMNEMCEILGGFRANLIGHGFSVEGAERIARELFISISDAAAAAGDDEDG